MKALVEPLRDEAVLAWRRGGAPVRAAVAVGVLLMAVGVLHGVAFAVMGGPWHGPVAWRKPFAFGLSFGMTTVTVAWIVSRLRVRRRWRAWLLAASTTTRHAQQLTRVAAAGYALVTVAALVQAASGRAAADPSAVAASPASAGLVAVAVPALVAISRAEPRLLVHGR